MTDLTQKEGGGGQQSIPAALAWAHPLVQDWFVEKFGTPTEPQEEGWPHILVTTPESLYILLTAEKSRELLRDVETVIVDEIHAIADDKRGAHLAISLERLDVLAHRKPVRIGLSATQKPIELVAKFLAGASGEPEVVNIGHKRRLDFAVEVPPSPLSAVMTHEMWDEVYDRLAQLTEQHRSTLIL